MRVPATRKPYPSSPTIVFEAEFVSKTQHSKQKCTLKPVSFVKPVGSEKFCSNCGAPTGQNKCANCGNDLAAGAKFCANCGTPVAASS